MHFENWSSYQVYRGLLNLMQTILMKESEVKVFPVFVRTVGVFFLYMTPYIRFFTNVWCIEDNKVIKTKQRLAIINLFKNKAFQYKAASIHNVGKYIYDGSKICK
jgi:hypothetical protein